MRRRDSMHSPGSGRSLITTRTSQQQRRMHGKSNLPRSYSSPASEGEQDQQNKYVRSFSSPEQKSKETHESLCQPKFYSSRSEIDSDQEKTFEQLDDSFLDIDADIEETFRQFERGSDVEEPKRVVTTLLPGNGLQKVKIKPIHRKQIPETSVATNSLKNTPKERAKGIARFHFRPLIVRIPSQVTPIEATPATLVELQNSPPLESEVAEIEREMADAEFLLNKGANIALQESDTDTSWPEKLYVKGGKLKARRLPQIKIWVYYLIRGWVSTFGTRQPH
ncbi:unnamed protein product [Pieris brassicae]|uniref:Uncharacterized protein n=1 Tax=Pieris brassicae TaxID=7116 RepID=A0A9P0TXA7_PIEBR|nr:unnamed protein product [Pieris brassicae]